MKNIAARLLGFVLLISSCGLATACFTAQESTAEVERPAAAPTQITTDADRRAAYNSGAGYGGSVPDATPGRVRVGEQASGINSRKRPESLNTNDANTTTNETRLRRLNGAPTDTTRRP